MNFDFFFIVAWLPRTKKVKCDIQLIYLFLILFPMFFQKQIQGQSFIRVLLSVCLKGNKKFDWYKLHVS